MCRFLSHLVWFHHPSQVAPADLVEPIGRYGRSDSGDSAGRSVAETYPRCGWHKGTRAGGTHVGNPGSRKQGINVRSLRGGMAHIARSR
jgi:hypothetical protein